MNPNIHPLPESKKGWEPPFDVNELSPEVQARLKSVAEQLGVKVSELVPLEYRGDSLESSMTIYLDEIEDSRDDTFD